MRQMKNNDYGELPRDGSSECFDAFEQSVVNNNKITNSS